MRFYMTAISSLIRGTCYLLVITGLSSILGCEPISLLKRPTRACAVCCHSLSRSQLTHLLFAGHLLIQIGHLLHIFSFTRSPGGFNTTLCTFNHRRGNTRYRCGRHIHRKSAAGFLQSFHACVNQRIVVGRFAYSNGSYRAEESSSVINHETSIDDLVEETTIRVCEPVWIVRSVVIPIERR